MPAASKRNLLYFQSPSMRGLHRSMDEWQQANDRQLSWVNIQRDDGNFCAIAIADPVEVTVTSTDGRKHATVSKNGRLFVYPSDYS